MLHCRYKPFFLGKHQEQRRKGRASDTAYGWDVQVRKMSKKAKEENAESGVATLTKDEQEEMEMAIEREIENAAPTPNFLRCADTLWSNMSHIERFAVGLPPQT
eukprot:3793681-Rhodomonas_salina.2